VDAGDRKGKSDGMGWQRESTSLRLIKNDLSKLKLDLPNIGEGVNDITVDCRLAVHRFGA